MSYPTAAGQPDNCTPFREPRMCLGPTWASSYYQFYLTGTPTPANVYQNGALTVVFPTTGKVTSDAYGRFPAIYLDPSVTYRVRFFNSANVQQWQQDPYISQLSTVGTSSLSAFGFQIAPTGEVTLDAPNTGGTGFTLTSDTGALGTLALKLQGTLPGNSALIVNNSATTGAQTASFVATNKPGTAGTQVTATAAPSGATYTGGTLTSNWAGASGSLYAITLSTGQNITGVTLTNGSTTFTTPSTNVTGTPTTSISVGPTPAGWLPVTCDGAQYYAPIWHGNSFTPYTSSPGALGEVINAYTVTFNGNGQTSTVGGTALPSNWFAPTAAGVGAGYYINVTRTGGATGVNFSAAQGVWVNIGAGGLTIGTSGGSGTVNGTYQLSTSNTGTPVVASGTITLGTVAVTHTYTSGTGATETVPAGASSVQIIAYGPGGSGSSSVNGNGGATGLYGGGGGAYVTLASIAVVAGSTMTYTVGQGGASANGNGISTPGSAGTAASTVTGTVSGGAINVSAGAGQGGGLTSGGAGGIASGGTTNTNGGAGSSVTGGAGAGPLGGLGGQQPGYVGSPLGGGGAGAAFRNGSGAGAGGQIQFIYS